MQSEEEILPALAKLDDDPASARPVEDVFVRRMVELVLIALRTSTARHDTHTTNDTHTTRH